MGRPPTGQTPVHSVRVPDHTWNTAKDNAKTEGHSISEVIVKLLTQYNASADRRRRTAGQA